MRPEEARILAERNIKPAVGPRFFREGDEVMFEFIIDTANIIGPRPATRGDQTEHSGAWAAFAREEDLQALDRDADGEAGGSLAAEPSVTSDEPPKQRRGGRRPRA